MSAPDGRDVSKVYLLYPDDAKLINIIFTQNVVISHVYTYRKQ